LPDEEMHQGCCVPSGPALLESQQLELSEHKLITNLLKDLIILFKKAQYFVKQNFKEMTKNNFALLFH
jgi:hypothetical protein